MRLRIEIDILYVVGVEVGRCVAQFRNVETLKCVVVECRMLLRQTEGLIDLPVFVDITEIWLSVKTIVTL